MDASNSESTRKNEIAPRITNQQMADLIALAHDAIIVRDPASVIITWNQGAERLYGWTAQEAIGRVSHALLQTHFTRSRKVTDILLEEGGQWEGQLTHIRRDGTQAIVESRQVLVFDDSGQPSAILEINRDITEREHMQHTQMETRARELALLETKEQMDEFLSVVSHELRTPMTTIKGNLQLAKIRLNYALRSLPPESDTLAQTLEEIQMMLDRAERQVKVQNRLIRDLLDISRIQTEQLELQQERCDLATIMNEAVADAQSIAPARPIHTRQAGEEAMLVDVDAERIGQVFSNYLTNALKYSPAGRPVEVRLEKQGKKARVCVIDQGPGLAPTERQRVWERFYRVEGIKRQPGFSVGLGLGLHICRAIIQQHGGEVGVESEQGVGSTFWFSLPLAE